MGTPARDVVLHRWFRRIADTYPKVTARFLTSQHDRFHNPVGHTLAEGIGAIYDEVASEMDESVIRNALDGILRIRSIQDFTPSEAVGFVFELKSVIRETVASDHSLGSLSLAAVDSRIDRVALLAFDVYAECRERLHRVRATEIRDRSIRLLERAGVAPVAVGHERTEEDNNESTTGGVGE